mmetsp:Transcript_15305/g.41935  ORF Transcript_15305/g.41935 Transcript_15305/m.41935 type:complete len:90 (+) Transcript_15305:23-292(+)
MRRKHPQASGCWLVWHALCCHKIQMLPDEADAEDRHRHLETEQAPHAQYLRCSLKMWNMFGPPDRSCHLSAKTNAGTKNAAIAKLVAKL